MKKIVLATVFALSQVVVASAFAQTAAPATRAEVKAETKEAVKAGKTVEGQAAPAQAMANKATSTAARADVKKEAASAEKAGTIAAGQVTKEPKATSTKPRAEVKSETKDAVKQGEIATGQGTPKK